MRRSLPPLLLIVALVLIPADLHALTGPTYPAPGGNGWVNPEISPGGPSGRTMTFVPFNLNASSDLYFGILSPSAQFSTGAALTFSAADSDLPGGVAVYTGSSTYTDRFGTTTSHFTRMVVSFTNTANAPLPIVLGSSVGASAGAVLEVTGDFKVKLQAQASGAATGPWTQLDVYFDTVLPNHSGGTASFSGAVMAFWYNQLPVAVADTVATDEDTQLSFNVMANDSDAEGDSFSLLSNSPAANGSALCDSAGTCVYTPNPQFNGSDGFTYTIQASNGGTATANVTVFVNAVADPPVATDDAYAVENNTTLTVVAPGVLANDTDGDGDTLQAFPVTGTTSGTLTLANDGGFVYTPNTNFAGIDSFTYQANDGTSNSNTATVTITVAQSVPTVSSITPTFGVHTGGVSVTATGTNFQPGAGVTVGGVAATGVVVNGSTSISFVTPALTPATLNAVSVTNPDLGSGALANAFMANFLDVPTGNGFRPFVESIFRWGVTGGCSSVNYCPNNSVTRAQLAVFLLRAKEGSTYLPPPATGTMFLDVPANGFAAAWIEELARRGITGGCGGGNYCPNSAVTREQMAVFLLATKEPPGYVPPPAVGLFDDVPVSSGFARWIEELAARGITGGCSVNPPLYCPKNAVTRGQMAVFLKVTFAIP